MPNPKSQTPPPTPPDPEQVFRDFLRQRQLKFTTERIAILQSVQTFHRPFEAEELLLQLRETGHRISKATVYRTLKHLLDSGLVKQVHFNLLGAGGGKQSHYDFSPPQIATSAKSAPAAGSTGGHDHLVDLDTGKILSFSSDGLIKLRDEIAKKMGFTPVSHHFQIFARRKT